MGTQEAVSALPIDPIDVRCPKCRRLVFIVQTHAFGQASIKCPKCDHVFTANLASTDMDEITEAINDLIERLRETFGITV
jgi:phage FluMu protein Com